MLPSQSQSSATSSPLPSASRQSRYDVPESKPFLTNHSLDVSSDPSASDLDSDVENGCTGQPATLFGIDEKDGLRAARSSRQPFSRWRIPFLRRIVNRSRKLSVGALDTSRRPSSPSLLRRILRLVGFLLMILGILNLVTVIIGIGPTLFQNDIHLDQDGFEMVPGDLRHWPTDSTADIHPIACHSHNDYWRKEPLFSALAVGCISVEADVWLFNDDLYVGHSSASLTTNRTLRSLYINPLLELLDNQNPTTEFHPRPDQRRNGVFDTDPEQPLVLLIDFKTDGEVLFSRVFEQLEPLRQRNYLSHFNGSSIVEGPITVVVTGNAPWNRVIENKTYRDMFFDAPLDLMANLDTSSSAAAVKVGISSPANSTTTPFSQPKSADSSLVGTADAGQGRSGAAPLNPAIYSPSNSFYASVSFKKSLFHKLPLPWQYPFRSTLTDQQLATIRAQIRGAHARGLKVRYWGVPDWPRGLREYLWRVLIREGVDYLNVDDLQETKHGKWAGRWEKGAGTWWDRPGQRSGGGPRGPHGGPRRRWWRHET